MDFAIQLYQHVRIAAVPELHLAGHLDGFRVFRPPGTGLQWAEPVPLAHRRLVPQEFHVFESDDLTLRVVPLGRDHPAGLGHPRFLDVRLNPGGRHDVHLCRDEPTPVPRCQCGVGQPDVTPARQLQPHHQLVGERLIPVDLVDRAEQLDHRVRRIKWLGCLVTVRHSLPHDAGIAPPQVLLLRRAEPLPGPGGRDRAEVGAQLREPPRQPVDGNVVPLREVKHLLASRADRVADVPLHRVERRQRGQHRRRRRGLSDRRQGSKLVEEAGHHRGSPEVIRSEDTPCSTLGRHFLLTDEPCPAR